MALNREWHLQNKMPKNPTKDQRIVWHRNHAQHCDCRKMPSFIQAEIEKQTQKEESS